MQKINVKLIKTLKKQASVQKKISMALFKKKLDYVNQC